MDDAACHSVRISMNDAAIPRATTVESHPRALTAPPAPAQEGWRRKLSDHRKKKDEEGGARLPGVDGLRSWQHARREEADLGAKEAKSSSPPRDPTGTMSNTCTSHFVNPGSLLLPPALADWILTCRVALQDPHKGKKGEKENSCALGKRRGARNSCARSIEEEREVTLGRVERRWLSLIF
jgi:hypothetical protein